VAVSSDAKVMTLRVGCEICLKPLGIQLVLVVHRFCVNCIFSRQQ